MADLVATTSPPSSPQRFVAGSRRFFRWLTTPHIVLSLIMLVVMYYMVIIPLYRMVETTVTWQPRDVVNHPEAVAGELTLFHYVRMLTGTLGKIYMYTPLGH